MTTITFEEDLKIATDISGTISIYDFIYILKNNWYLEQEKESNLVEFWFINKDKLSKDDLKLLENSKKSKNRINI